MARKVLGKVTHYFDHLGVAVIKLGKGAGLKKGEKIQFKGNGTDFTQEVGSLQVDHEDVEAVKAGDDFGLKVDKPVKENDQVYLAEK
ncbi:MAG: translation elongation factor-like protein [Patescibacteria group bacterium]